MQPSTSNPILDFGIDKTPCSTLATTCSARSASWRSPTARCGPPTPAAASCRSAPTAPSRSSRSSRSGALRGRPAARRPATWQGTLPNGLAFARNGDFLIANFGTDRLEVMTRDGSSRVLADTIDGQPIGKVNFVAARLARTASGSPSPPASRTGCTRCAPTCRTATSRATIDGNFRIVADGFRFTNEIRFDAKEEFLYVVETTGGCITPPAHRREGQPDGPRGLRPRQPGKGAWPDGIAFDSYGNLWGTMVYSDKLFVLTPQGDLRLLLDEGDPQKVDALEQAFFGMRT